MGISIWQLLIVLVIVLLLFGTKKLKNIEKQVDTAEKNHSDLWLSAAARVVFMSYFIELPGADAAGLSRAWKGISAVTERVRTNDAFLVTGPYDDVGNQDPAQAAQIRANTIDEVIRTTTEAFLGITVGCARCHDHKFDPIRQADYYSLYATFAGVSAARSRRNLAVT